MKPTKKQLEAEIKEAEDTLKTLRKMIKPYEDKLEKNKELYDKLYVPKYKFEADVKDWEGKDSFKLEGKYKSIQSFLELNSSMFNDFMESDYYAFITKEGKSQGIWKVSPEDPCGGIYYERMTKAEYKEQIEWE